MVSLLSWIQRVFCCLRGHDQLLEFEAGRMFLRCVSCGRETHGWEIGRSVTQPWKQTPEPARRPRPQLARARQIA